MYDITDVYIYGNTYIYTTRSFKRKENMVEYPYSSCFVSYKYNTKYLVRIYSSSSTATAVAVLVCSTSALKVVHKPEHYDCCTEEAAAV